MILISRSIPSHLQLDEVFQQFKISVTPELSTAIDVNQAVSVPTRALTLAGQAALSGTDVEAQICTYESSS
jgi:hypothetical protein